MVSCLIPKKRKDNQLRFRNVLPPAVVLASGATFSFFCAAAVAVAVFLAAAAFVIVVAAAAAAATVLFPAVALVLGAAAAVPAPRLIIVVPALVLLASLDRARFSWPDIVVLVVGAVAVRFVWRLGAREGAFVGAAAVAAGLIGLVGRDIIEGFSSGFTGERGRVRELCERGDRTADGTILRDAARGAFEFAAVVVVDGAVVVVVIFVRFLGLEEGC